MTKQFTGHIAVSFFLFAAASGQAPPRPVRRGQEHRAGAWRGDYGSGWRGVYDILTRDGYHVSVVQQPLTGLADDVAAAKRVIDRQDGPVVLVGHSYGGTIITVAGADPKVKALVYVAALQPDVGEATNQLSASIPGTVPSSDIQPTGDGFLFVNPANFVADVAADLPPAQAKFMADSQMPVQPQPSLRP